MPRCLLWLLCACGPARSGTPAPAGEQPDPEAPAPADSDASGVTARTFVVLGSSTAAAFGLRDPAEGWVARWADGLARDHHPDDVVVNLAVPGFRTDSITPGETEGHDVTTALTYDPDAIVVNLPSNDAAAGLSVDQSFDNLALVDQAASEAGVALWVTTSQPRVLGEAGSARLVGYRDRVLATYGARALDYWTPLATAEGGPDPAVILPDGIHPNAEGHARLLAVIVAADLPGALDGEGR